MKAFLLAAGLGTRLKPITDTIPKCLVPICGKPLLAWWFELLVKHKVDEVLINLHYLSDKVIDFCSNFKTNIKIKSYYEKELLGSAGTLRVNKEFVKYEKNFFILYADNLTNVNLTEFKTFHNNQKFNFSMALFRTDEPHSKGIIQLKDSVVIDFEEKPKNPKSNLANAGIYICEPSILDMIPNKPFADIGFDLLPQLIGKMNGWEIKDYLTDIGTMKDYLLANKEWSKTISKRRIY